MASSGLGNPESQRPRSPSRSGPPRPCPGLRLRSQPQGKRPIRLRAPRLHSWTASPEAPSLPEPAGKVGLVFPPPLDAVGAQETSASCPHPALGSCFPLPSCPPSCVLSSLGSAILAKPQPLTIVRAHPAPGQPRRGRDSPRGPPAPGAAPPQPRALPAPEASARLSSGSPTPRRAARIGRGGTRRPGKCPGGRGHRAGRRAQQPGRERQPDRSPRAKLQIAAVSSWCPASLPAFRTFGIFSPFFLPPSPLPCDPCPLPAVPPPHPVKLGPGDQR